MPTSILKIAIVGCGKIADAHIEQIRAVGGAEVVAVCDVEPLMARQLATRFSIGQQFNNFSEMLARARPDVVHITTPPQSHLALALEAMQAGCHVFIEKPLALDVVAGRKIADAAHTLQRKLSINYWYNFDPPSVQLQDMLHAGVLGDVVHVESTLGYDLSGDYGAAVLGDPSHWVHRLPGKLFHNVLDHVVSKIALFMPDATPQVVALDYRRRPACDNPVLDGMADELRFLFGGATVSAYGLISSQVRPAGHILRVCGTLNTVSVDYNQRTVIVESDQKYPSMLGRLLPAFVQARQYRRAARKNVLQFLRADFHYFQGMRYLLHLFYDSIRHDTAPPIAYDEIVRVTQLMDSLISHLRQTQTVVQQQVT